MLPARVSGYIIAPADGTRHSTEATRVLNRPSPPGGLAARAPGRRGP